MTPRTLLALAVMLTGLPPANAPAATPDDPAVQQMIGKGVDSLKRYLKGANQDGYDSLAGYAAIKGGVPVDDPVIERTLQRVLGRFKVNTYEPGGHGRYTAGCDLMFLESLHDEQYKPHMAAIVAHIAQTRTSDGVWHYPNTPSKGDQSITQYAVLGLWAAERAEVHVPPQLWDGVAAWQVKVQNRDGGFAYHPDGGGDPSTPTMSAAGISNLLVARKYLYKAGDIPEQKKADEEKPKPKKLRFGVLKRVEAEEAAEAPTDDEPEEPGPQRPTNYRPVTPLPLVEAAIARSAGALNGTVPAAVKGDDGHRFYLWYGIERMAALANMKVVGGQDWYDAGVDFLSKSQTDWLNASEKTAFAVLFLTQATSKILGRKPEPKIDVGAGLLAGGRGLPEDLSQIESLAEGEAKVRQATEPLDELFAALGDPSTGQTVDAQAAIVEKLRLGDREELIGQIDRVLDFVEHPHYEIRRTGVWVLGRTEDLTYVDKLVDALLDENLDVAVEARNALCFMARKPRGVGMSDDPFAAVPEGSTDEQRKAAAKKWQEEAHTRWAKWASEKRPYAERDRISQLNLPDEDDSK